MIFTSLIFEGGGIELIFDYTTVPDDVIDVFGTVVNTDVNILMPNCQDTVLFEDINRV